MINDDYDLKEKYYKNYLIMGKFFFKIREVTWWFVAEIEDWLYPYQDRPVEDDPYDHTGRIDINEAAYLRSLLNTNNDRIERLQSEMIHVLNKLNEHEIKLKEYGQEQSSI